MLEVPGGQDYRQWDDGRIWAELEHRLTAAGRPPVQRGEFAERDILDLRVRVCDPMQHGRLFLAGDAAHLITPAGGKGMNIAIQDAAELAGGLIGRYGGGGGDGRRLDRYSPTRLPGVWRNQEFSNLMLRLFNAGPADGDSGFSYGLRRARLGLVLTDPEFSRWFARSYVGVDE
jgi:p-hydroxybenzoate 3-monooxygenase